MAWKLVSEDKGFGGAPFCDAFNRRFSAREDTKYRVTVEAEVSECCEKWRCEDMWTRFEAALRCQCVPSFCPQCGRKL